MKTNPLAPALNPNKVGIAAFCTKCRRQKTPRGRSAPLIPMCDFECEGYDQEPRVGDLWPAESEAEFGYLCGDEATRILGTGVLTVAPAAKEDGIPAEPECVCEGEFPQHCGPECDCFHHDQFAGIRPKADASAAHWKLFAYALEEKLASPVAALQEPEGEMELLTPLARNQITPEIADLARKAVASHTVGMGHSVLAAAGIYAAYTIIRERQLLAALAELRKYPAKWWEDSSLETWFPLTAEEMVRLKAEVAELRKLRSQESK